MSDPPSSTTLHNGDHLKPELTMGIKPATEGAVKLGPAMKPKIPTLATRRAACTHMTMERWYGNYECDVCRQPSMLGWVYSCTQDANPDALTTAVDENLCDAISDSADQNVTTKETSTFDMGSTTRMPTLELGPGMEKAIEDGHYSPTQVQILRAQKRRVVELAYATVAHFEREARYKENAGFQRYSIPKGSPQEGNDGAEKQGFSTATKFRMFPYCHFRACQTCRPTYRDRAWQKFDDIFAKDASKLVESEYFSLYATRPMNSCEVMQNIGKAGLSRPPLLHGECHILSCAKQCKYIPDTNGLLNVGQQLTTTEIFQPADAVILEPQDITDDDSQYEAEVRGFRESLRRRFLKGLNERDSEHLSKKQKLIWSAPGVSYNAPTWTAINDPVLRDAATVPLPEQDITDGLASNDNEVKDVCERKKYLELNAGGG